MYSKSKVKNKLEKTRRLDSRALLSIGIGRDWDQLIEICRAARTNRTKTEEEGKLLHGLFSKGTPEGGAFLQRNSTHGPSLLREEV